MRKQGYYKYAKTLYKPTRPKHIDTLITSFTKDPLPHFFKYAKDKSDEQVAKKNDSFVNKLDSIVPNPRINCRKLGLNPIDCTVMMNDPDIELEIEFTDNGKLVKENTNPVINKYYELSKKYYLSLDSIACMDKNFSPDILTKSQLKQDLKYKTISNEIKSELSKYGYSDIEIVDILVKFLYGVHNKSKNKMALWLCYGDIIYENIRSHIKPQTKQIQCVDCGLWFEVGVKDTKTCRCEECQKEYRNACVKANMQRYRDKKRLLSDQN